MSRVTSMQEAMQNIYLEKKNSLVLDKCTGFVIYILGTLHFARKDSGEYGYQDIGHGVGTVFSRVNVDYKVIGQKFHELGDGMDYAIDWFNTGSMELRDKMIAKIESKRSNYYVEKMYYDLAAVWIFFEKPNIKLIYTVDGSNVFKDW